MSKIESASNSASYRRRTGVLLLLTVAILGISLIKPIYPLDQTMQHIPTVLSLIVLAIARHKKWLSTFSFACVIGFIWLHILGARYTYSNVPYDAWSQSIVGSEISSWFGWERNHFDRLVHWSFGFLCAIPFAELGMRLGKMNKAWAYAFSLSAVMAVGGFYEIVEWGVAVFMSPEAAETYNGQQGDLWDPQKDMALAGIGAILALVVDYVVLCRLKK